MSRIMFRNNNVQQEQERQGNNIFIYPTPITTTTASSSSSWGTPENHVTTEKKDPITIAITPMAATNEKVAYFKRVRRLGSYFSRLLNHSQSDNNHQSTVIDTAQQQHRPACWKQRLKFQRKKNSIPTTITTRPVQQFIWCFRPVGTAAAFKSSSTWTKFEKKNQLELSRQLNLLSNRDATSHQNSFEIQDKHILNNTVVITVMLKEGIAFVLDPEWSKPITYEITCRPKLNWFEEIYMRHRYRKMLRDQHKAAKAAALRSPFC